MTTSVIKFLIPLAILVALVVGGLSLVKSQVASNKDPAAAAQEVVMAVGKTLPDFELHRFEGEAVKASALPAKVTLVNFWATWCEACMVEMPSIAKLREAYKDKGFEVAAVNVDQNPSAVIPRAVKKLGISFPVYVDKEQALSDLFDIEAIPLTVIIDKDRKILLIENGERDWNGADIRAELEKWLAG